MSDIINSAIIPVPKLENDFYDWYQRHEQKKLAASGRRRNSYLTRSVFGLRHTCAALT
jgi:uncharacterized NAD(P)/FAD-binding protein YdhS